MEINEIIILEVDGMTETIKDYTTEKYIISYADKLKELKYPADENLITVIVNRLLEWYHNEIAKISKSNYIVNKSDHIKSINVLTEIKKRII